MPRSDDIEDAPVSSRRLEAFTDGVFAIAATLLVLNLSVDALGKGITTDTELWHALVHGMWGNFLSLIISFLILVMLWRTHVWQFEYVEKVTKALATFNSFRLLGVVLVPFTTSLSGSYSDLIAGRLALPLNFLYIAIVGAVEWFYATSTTRNLVPKLSAEHRRNSRAGALGFIASSVVVTALAPFLGPWAYLGFFLNAAFDPLFKLRSKPRRDESSPSTGS